MRRGQQAGFTAGDDQETSESERIDTRSEDEAAADAETATDAEPEEEYPEEEDTSDASAPVVRVRAVKAEETGTATDSTQIEYLHFGDTHYQHGAETFTGTVPFNVSTTGGRFKFEELKAAQERRNKRVKALMRQHEAMGIYNPVPARVHYTVENPVT